MAEFKSLFTTSIKTGIAPLTVNFTNTSTGSFTSVLWDFGDGNTSTEIHPSHQYLNDGVFQTTLTIFALDSTTSISSQSITVFADNVLQSADSNEQFGLFATKRFDPGQVHVIKQIQSGSTYETTYPLSSSHVLNYASTVLEVEAVLENVFMTQAKLDNMSAKTGITIINTYTGLTSISNIVHPLFHWVQEYSGSIDYSKSLVCIPLLSSGTSASASADTSLSYFTSNFSATTGMPQFEIYNLTGLTHTTGTYNTSEYELKVNRDLPWRGELNNAILPIYLILNTISGTTNSYAGNGYDDPSENWLKIKFGIDDLNEQIFDDGTYNHNAAANELLLKAGAISTSTLGQNKAIIYPDYIDITNTESFVPGAQYLSIPWIMYDKSLTSGLKLYDSYGGVELDPISSQRFKYLRDGQTSSDNIIGRVYHDLKCVIIDDPEINIALQSNSNRSYTLPTPTISQINDSGGWLDTGMTYFITYIPELNSNESSGYSNTFGMGGVNVYPCGNYATVTPSMSDSKITFHAERSRWAVDDTSNDVGFIHNSGGYVFIATGTNETTLDHSSWRYSAYTSSVFSAGTELDTPYASMIDVDWGTVSSPVEYLGQSEFTPGDEKICMGYMSGNLETSIYKLGATCVAKNNEFNSTQNPTHTEGDSVYVSEVGIYNESNELLMVGKLSKPIEKNDEKYVVIKMELDL